MRNYLADGALRRGTRDGAIIAGVLAVLVVLTNVVFPSGPHESDGDPQYQVLNFAAVTVMAILLITIGARARRRSDTTLAGAKGGAAAGFVIAVLITLTFLAVNNLFLDVVAQQLDKQVRFAHSGWSSMRAYLSVTQLRGGALHRPARYPHRRRPRLPRRLDVPAAVPTQRQVLTHPPPERSSLVGAIRCARPPRVCPRGGHSGLAETSSAALPARAFQRGRPLTTYRRSARAVLGDVLKAAEQEQSALAQAEQARRQRDAGAAR